MNKKIIIFLLLLIIASALVFAISGLNRDQRKIYSSCRRNCSRTKMTEKRACNAVSYPCGKACQGNKTAIYTEIYSEYRNCTSECNTNIPENITKKEASRFRRACRKNCSSNLRTQRKLTYSNYRECRGICQGNKRECKKTANENSFLCRDDCLADILALINTTPENNTNETETNETEDNETKIIKYFCPKARPTNCTDEYAPVCSNKETGFNNSCLACSQRGIRWYKNGTCT